ncbi:MAG TPA: methylmalonyl-CoA mutase family protein [Planctomycetota bacterium]|nr:methylmalonyl-CoA mutase family protein [Planctomycetota bacterium]
MNDEPSDPVRASRRTNDRKAKPPKSKDERAPASTNHDPADPLGAARDAYDRKVGSAKLRDDAREFTTLSGEPVEALYDPTNAPRLDPEAYLRDLGYPGEYPFTRGIHPNLYRGKLWTMRQFAGFGTANDTNRRYHFLLEHGQTGLSVAFDFPTLMGYDSDHPRSRGEVGRCGVAISSLADMETLFEGIPLDRVSTSMTINGPAAILWAFYIAAAEKQGIPAAQLRGTIQNDILKEFQAQHAWLVPLEPALRIVVDTMEFGAKHVPLWNTVSISGYHIREAGSTALQELAFTLANGFEYVERGLARGMAVDEFAPRLAFFWDVHIDFFEEIAKFRAARRIWARHLKERYGAKDPRSMLVRTHAQTAGVSLTAQQPENNIVRVAYQALAAVLGGTQSLHTNSMDETLALPTEKSVKIALRTQQVLAYETEVPHVVDPLGGSYFIESLTDRLESEAEDYFRRISERGGMVRATQEGWIQREIHRSSTAYQRSVEEKRKTIVGVNRFVEDERDVSIPVLKIDSNVDDIAAQNLRDLRKRRDAARVKKSLDAVREACKDGSNLMPRFVEAARSYATLGEIAGVLREEFGAVHEPKF